MTLSRFALIANILGLVLMAILAVQDWDYAATPDDQIGLYLPILSIVFLGLALRSIGKDEKLVKSMDRLR